MRERRVRVAVRRRQSPGGSSMVLQFSLRWPRSCRRIPRPESSLVQICPAARVAAGPARLAPKSAAVMRRPAVLLLTAVSVAAAAGVAVAGQATRGRPAGVPPRGTVVTGAPAYLVGAATADITPAYGVNLGGFGLGDGSFFPEALVGRGGTWDGSNPGGQPRIRSRAVVFDDGNSAVAIADIETQGMFAAYENGRYGLHDMAEQVAKDIPGLPADHIGIASDPPPHAPDTIGAWGGVPDDYLQLVFDRTVATIEQAYRDRVPADVFAGQSDASSLIYNQSCSEALNQSKEPAYTGPDACATPGKDGMMRVVQARTPAGQTVVTLVDYAAHSTTNMGSAGDGDWPQFLGDYMAPHYGGGGIGLGGAQGGPPPR